MQTMPTRAPDSIPRSRRHALLLLLALSCLLPACSERRDTSGQAQTQAPAPPSPPATAPAQPEAQELTIFAAASLLDAFEAIATDFRRAHPGVDITFNFAGSQELRTQIEHGAPADVFASADRKHMDALVQQGLARPAAIFARNHLVLVVPRGATTLKDLQELPRAQRIVIGGPDVPVGRYTRQLLTKATSRWPGFEQQVMAHVVSEELNVRQVLAKITLGEADAGIVYRTDAATAADKVDVIAIPADLDVVAEYPIAALARAPQAAQTWVDYVRLPAGQQTLARFGFEPSGDQPGGQAGGQPGAQPNGQPPGSETRPTTP